MGDDKMKLPQFDGHWDHWSEVMENFFRNFGETSKIIWDSMKRKLGGNARVKESLLQKLRRDFEVLEIKDSEKILRTLSERFTYVVVSIEESKEIESISLDELPSSLVVHEQKFKRTEKSDEQVLSATQGRGRCVNTRGRGRGRGSSFFDKSNVECYKCHQLGHFQNECPKWEEEEEEEANYADFEEEMLLMAHIEDMTWEESGQ